MRPTVALNALLTHYMTTPGHVASATPEADFVSSALRAAQSSPQQARVKIMSDVADILGCAADDLDFLFQERVVPIARSTNYEVMVPDFQTQLLAAAE